MQTPVIFQFNGPKCFLISQLNFKQTETKLSQVVKVSCNPKFH